MKLTIILSATLLFSTCLAGDFFFEKIKNDLSSFPRKDLDPKSYIELLKSLSLKINSPNGSYWSNYLEAKTWALHKAPHSCPIFKQLANLPDHPLYPITLTQIAEFCVLNMKEKEALINSMDNFIKTKVPPLWIQNILNKSQIQLGRKALVLPYVKRSSSKIEKVTLLQKEISAPHSSAEEKLLFKNELARISPRFNDPSNLKAPSEKLAAAQDALLANEGPTALQILKNLKGFSFDQTHRALEIIKNAQKMSQKKNGRTEDFRQTF